MVLLGGVLAQYGVTDYVFADPQKIHYSMVLVTFVMGLVGVD
jgi:hypothetical protein